MKRNNPSPGIDRRAMLTALSVLPASGMFLPAPVQAQVTQVGLLPSWNDGAAKPAIVDFVKAVTDEKGKDFVPVAERIAVFDNDGTLWAEKPAYIHVYALLDRVKEQMAANNCRGNRMRQKVTALTRGVDQMPRRSE